MSDHWMVAPDPADVDGHKVIDLAESISQVGLLLPIVVTPEGEIVDGKHRYFAAGRVNGTPLASVRTDEAAPSPREAASLLRARVERGQIVSPPPGAPSRRTLERVLDIVDVASAVTWPARIRKIAVDALTQVDEGEPAARAHRHLMREIAVEDVEKRYPQLRGRPHDEQLRLAAHFDSLDDEQRAIELAVASSLLAPAEPSAAIAAYEGLAAIETALDSDTVRALSEAYTSACSEGSMTEPLRMKARAVGDRLMLLADTLRSQGGGSGC